MHEAFGQGLHEYESSATEFFLIALASVSAEAVSSSTEMSQICYLVLRSLLKTAAHECPLALRTLVAGLTCY